MSLSHTERHRAAARLARWLGPWSSARQPPGVTRREATLGAGAHQVRSYAYEPAGVRPSGCYVVVPGLHYQGPDDPRLDRFCRTLAAAGLLVVAPFVRDYLSLVVAESAVDDALVATEHAAALCSELRLPPPALFSISFGSTPAIRVAAHPRLATRLSALVLFGGYADFFACIRFAVGKRSFDGQREIAIPHDPLNTPAVLINVVGLLDIAEPDRRQLAGAWLELARRTWGRPALRPAARRRPIAAELASELPSRLRELFWIGSGLEPGAAALLEAALARAEGRFGFTDPAPHLPAVRVPIAICHGRDDDVIPFTEAFKLRACLAPDQPHRLMLTGLYGHTGAALPGPGALAAEATGLLELVYALLDAPHGALSA